MATLSRRYRSQQQILEENYRTFMQSSFLQWHRILDGFFPENILNQNDQGNHSRKRFFTKANTFFGFLSQILHDDGGCQDTVHRLREQALAQGISPPSANTAAYSKARSRLDADELADVFYHGAGAVELEATRPFGRPLVGVDGTTFSMPDTESNQEAWPQSSEQKEGLGFPMMKLVGAFSLDTGALLDGQAGNKHDHELTLCRELWESFQKGDILVKDRAYCSYCDLAELKMRGVDMVVRLNRSRKEIPVSNAVTIVSEDDRWVEWNRPEKQSDHLTDERWEAIPATLKVRQITYRVEAPGFRSRKIVVITTLNEEEYTREDVAEMYRLRWHAEVFFRHLKQTLGSHILRCKTSGMIMKELWMNLIGYNAICYLQMKAAGKAGINRVRLSFKGCLQVARAWENRFRDWKACARRLRHQLYNNLVVQLVSSRPNRVEPRANKRRPKIIRLMTKPRRVLQARLRESMPGSIPLKTPLS